MLRLPKILLPAAAGLVAAASLAGAAAPASAHPWWERGWHDTYRCDGDGDRCAWFRCDGDGDRCERTGAWQWRGQYRGYRHYGYGNGYGYGWNRGYRCDADGDRCWRTDGWR